MPVLAVICEQPVEYDFRDGLVYATDPDTGAIRAFRLRTFYASFHNAAKCMQDCHKRTEAEVIPFPAKGDAGH